MSTEPTSRRRPEPTRSPEPRVIIEQRGQWRWETWVALGMLRYAGEWGTYAWTERGAIRKGHRLLRRYLKSRPRNRRDVTGERS